MTLTFKHVYHTQLRAEIFNISFLVGTDFQQIVRGHPGPANSKNLVDLKKVFINQKSKISFNSITEYKIYAAYYKMK